MNELFAYGKNIIVKEIKEEEKKTGVLILNKPESNYVFAEVVNVGEEGDETIEEGDKLMISKYGHVEISFEGKEYLICKPESIYARVIKG